MTRVVQIVIKNTSELDYSAAVLRRLTRAEGNDVSVLYCALSRRQFLRDSQFYSELCEDCGIPELDFTDFLRPAFRPFAGMVRSFFSVPYSDWLTPRMLLSELRSSQGWSWITPRTVRRLMRLAADFLRSRLEPMVMRLVDVETVLERLDPDIVLLGNRSRTHFYGRDHFYRWYDHEKRPVVLLPHGTHEVHPWKEFIPFDEHGEAMADYCDFWSAFREEPWHLFPERRRQFANIGYPGLDTEWLDYVGGAAAERKPAEPVRALLILRRFLPSGFNRPADYDPFTLNYELLLRYLNLVGDAIRRTGREVEILIKPHPSNNFPMTASMLRASTIPQWRISADPMYPLLAEVDFAISIFSTSLLIPAMYGLPTIVLNSELQQYVHNRWPVLAKIYTGLRYYLPDPEDLEAWLPQVLREAEEGRAQRSPRANPDVIHLRQYYPDGAIETAISRLRAIQIAQLRGEVARVG